ncbi:cell surface protein [Carnobacterium maltaromaticum]|uniref:Cell surface protein n=1 Tax=Carnobacterium maltaromaticum TaxID=2751 RepID=A0AAW9KA58_CARML|nr:cell surface protein [Carnobacterium maltaromaticum]MDZ5759996.1 cell surface protein [Carnobacterium maltaromaticum]
MNKNKILLTIVSIIISVFILNPSAKANSAPPQSLPIDNVFFVPQGANSFVEGNTVIITKDQRSQVGSIFSSETNKINLNQSFHAEMYVYLGDKNALAADGMAFVMHADENRTKVFTGGTGAQLGVLAKLDSGPGLLEQIERSFAVEFDTYLNTDGMDTNLDKNGNRGHVAYTFPELLSSYNLKNNKPVSLKHQGLYYPIDYLSNGKWHLFSVDWDAIKQVLTYKFDNAPNVSVPINPSVIFGTNSVYWGFTGSTGALSQESKVAFKQIPGLVNLSSTIRVTKDGKDIMDDKGVSAADKNVKVQYDLQYLGGKQNLMNANFDLLLDEGLSYKPGTLTVDGSIVSDDYFKNGNLNYKIPKDLSETNDTLSISFEVIPKVVTVNDITTDIKYVLNSDNYFGNDESLDLPVSKVKIVKSSYFENQSWLINEINRQLAPKKIDVDLYEPDLAQIKQIELTAAPKVLGEHIPKTIDSLVNLNYIRLVNQKLVGVLPEEVGNLSKLTYLSIYGNTFDGEIPQSIGNLKDLTLIALDNNHLKGTVPTNIASLPKLNQIYLNGNNLSGQLPDFQMNMLRISINNNQLTYNSAEVPSFLKNAKTKAYHKTFIQGLKLTGNSRVVSKNKQIKPFDKINEGYFNLKAMDGAQDIDLVDEHSYIIKNTVDGTVYYNGKKDVEVSIPYEKEISYTVILDEAEKNPNNVFTILGKARELKFSEIPLSIGLKIKLGAGKQPVVPEGKLEIFDDRENKNWKLSITPSELKQGQIKLQGEYSYTDKAGVSYPIVSGQKYLIETGESDSANEVIPISNYWNDKRGLSYTAYRSNYTGDYKGNVIWTLEDTP